MCAFRGVGWSRDTPKQGWGQFLLKLGGDREGQTLSLLISGVQDGVKDTPKQGWGQFSFRVGDDREGQTLLVRVWGCRMEWGHPKSGLGVPGTEILWCHPPQDRAGDNSY